MLRIALNLGGAAILDRDQHSASVGAIVRTRGMDDLLRHRSIIKCFFQNDVGREKNTGELYGRPF